MELPRYAVTAGTAAFLDPTSYEFDKLELVNGKAEDEEWAFQFDASRQITLDNGDLELKLGAKFRQRTKEFDLLLQVYDGFSGNYTLADVAGAQSYGLTSINPLTDLSRVRAFNAANFASFEINQADTDFESNIEDFTVDEDITAGYVMVRYETGPLMIVGGVRVEKTENDIQANLTEYVEEGGVYNGVVLADDTVFVTPNDFSKSYTDALPSASLRYDWSEDVLLRAGFFKSIVRPNIASLAPRFIVEEDDGGDRGGEFGNPALEPYEAWNFDASIEWYMTPDSVVQFGVFNKQIDNFIVNVEFDDTDAPYLGVYNGIAFSEAVIPLNGDEATVNGFEFNYQQAMTHLPAPFDGLIVGFNYTYTDSEGDIGARNIPLPAASENNYNVLLGYEKGPVSIRVTAAYRDSYLDELGDDASEDRYVEDHLQWDMTASYAVTERVKVYAQFVNLNDEPYVAYQRGPDSNRLLQYEEYSWTGKLGIQASF
jgi:TonB-dependent receptor